jgi:hypothetical protein
MQRENVERQSRDVPNRPEMIDDRLSIALIPTSHEILSISRPDEVTAFAWRPYIRVTLWCIQSSAMVLSSGARARLRQVCEASINSTSTPPLAFLLKM